ncbi:MAG: hypothetical protein LUH15_17145 [Tannerellaceae bacterium]|nr:hypothetical protein [Tannerellaceae bacterium]
MNSTIKTNRIEVIDALRGFSIIAILLLHNLEHFDLYFLPEQLPAWMKIVDKKYGIPYSSYLPGRLILYLLSCLVLLFIFSKANKKKKGMTSPGVLPGGWSYFSDLVF